MDISPPLKKTSLGMFAKRTLVALVLLPVGLAFVYLGGWAFTAFVSLMLGVAAWEYQRMFRAGGFAPAGGLLIVGCALLAAWRGMFGFSADPLLLSLLTLAALTWHLVEFERGSPQGGSDFGLTAGGLLYIGWIGAYLVSLRSLPDGMGWLLTALPAVWAADSGAYFIGSRWGRHKLSPRLSPKKSWEGYWAGVVSAVLMGALLGAAWPLYYGPATAITPLRGALLGLLLGLLTTLGDLGESMFKRQAGVKDSSSLIPGHGGVFDRIDSWLWAGVISYFVILAF